jgi:hypothetical protein
MRQLVAKNYPSHQHECTCIYGCADTVLFDKAQVLEKLWRVLEPRIVCCTRFPLGMSVCFEIVDQGLYVLQESIGDGTSPSCQPFEQLRFLTVHPFGDCIPMKWE